MRSPRSGVGVILHPRPCPLPFAGGIALARRVRSVDPEDEAEPRDNLLGLAATEDPKGTGESRAIRRQRVTGTEDGSGR